MPRYTALEVDERLASALRRGSGSSARIVAGDGAAMPFSDASFSAVVCFTMLHHVPSPEAQDALFSEAFRALRPGGVLAGSDSLPSAVFRLIHLGDTMVTVEPRRLPDRLRAAGFGAIDVTADGGKVRFVAKK